MKITFSSRFLQQLPALPPNRRAEVLEAAVKIPDAFRKPHSHTGLGLRKLATPYWEVRVGLDIRLVFELQKDHALLHILGNHDDVQRYLRSL